LPVLSVWEFIETASARQGMWDFGFRVAEHVTLPRAARWGRQVASAVTLHNAITIMAQTIGSDMPNVVVGLERRGEESWLWRDHVPDRRHMCGYWLGEQYILGLMIEMLRLVEGQSWYPKRIELQATASQWGGAPAGDHRRRVDQIRRAPHRARVARRKPFFANLQAAEPERFGGFVERSNRPSDEPHGLRAGGRQITPPRSTT
jgi:hypothetical protein